MKEREKEKRKRGSTFGSPETKITKYQKVKEKDAIWF